MIDALFNLSDPDDRQRMLELLRDLRGQCLVQVRRVGPRRSENQVKLYFAQIVRPFRDFLREQGQAVTDQMAHQQLKRHLLTETVFDPATGQVLGDRVRSIKELSSAEMSAYIDQCVQWLAEHCDLHCLSLEIER